MSSLLDMHHLAVAVGWVLSHALSMNAEGAKTVNSISGFSRCQA